MANSWETMKKAKEDDYFEKKNKEALEKIVEKKEHSPRKSPITGELMEVVDLHGVTIDRCKTSGGIWLDAGELEQLVEKMAGEKAEGNDFVSNFFKGLLGKS